MEHNIEHTIKVKELSVSCSGYDEVSAHPKIYLHIDRKEGSITCPYCTKEFRYIEG